MEDKDPGILATVRRHPVWACLLGLVAFLWATWWQICQSWSAFVKDKTIPEWTHERGWDAVIHQHYVQWLSYAADGFVVVLILTVLAAFRKHKPVRRHSHEVQITLIGHAERSPFFTVRVINHCGAEERVRAAKFVVLHKSGEKEEIGVYAMRGCSGFPHVMPPRSAFDVDFKTSINGIRSYNWSKDADAGMLIMEYFATIEFETGDSIEGEHVPVPFEPPTERPQGRVSGTGALHILSAKYGAASNWVDVTEDVKRVVGESGGSVFASHAHLRTADPIHGKSKTLEIQYTVDGREINIAIPENDTINLLSEQAANRRVNLKDVKPPTIDSLKYPGAVTVKKRGPTEDEFIAPIARAEQQMDELRKSGALDRMREGIENAAQSRNERNAENVSLKAAEDLYNRCAAEMRNKRHPIEALIIAGVTELDTNDDLLRLVEELMRNNFRDPFDGVLAVFPKADRLEILKALKRTNLDFSSDDAFRESFIAAALWPKYRASQKSEPILPPLQLRHRYDEFIHNGEAIYKELVAKAGGQPFEHATQWREELRAFVNTQSVSPSDYDLLFNTADDWADRTNIITQLPTGTAGTVVSMAQSMNVTLRGLHRLRGKLR